MREPSSGEADGQELTSMELPEWVMSADRFIEGTLEPEFLVDQLIERGTLIVIQGEPGCGKTWVALELAGAVAHGLSAFGRFAAHKHPVLFIEEEGNAPRLRQRLRLLGLEARNLVIAFRKGVRLDDSEWRARIEELLGKHPFALVVLDPLADLLEGDENSARDMAQIVSFAQALISKFPHLSVLIVHHVQKQAFGARRGSLKHGRGSGRLGGSADAVFEVLRRPRKAEEVLAMDLESVKSRSEVQPLLCFVLDLTGQRATWAVVERSPSSRDSDSSASNISTSIREQILTAAKAGQCFKSANEASKALHQRKADVLTAWKAILEEGALAFDKETGAYVIGSGNQSGTTMASGSGNHVGTEAPGSRVPAPLGAEPASSSAHVGTDGKASSRKPKPGKGGRGGR
jgi:hypothetical protein